MSRSIKHSPVFSEKPVASEKDDKQRASKARRALARRKLAQAQEDADYDERDPRVAVSHSKGERDYEPHLRVKPEGRGLRVIELPEGGFDGRKAHKALAK